MGLERGWVNPDGNFPSQGPPHPPGLNRDVCHPPSSCFVKHSLLISHALQRTGTLLAHRCHHAICFKFVPRALPLCRMSREREKYNYLVTAVLTQGRATPTSHSLSVLLTNCPGLLLPYPSWEVTQSSTSSFPFHPTSFFLPFSFLKTTCCA